MKTWDIVGLGACGVDLTAEVPSYPREGKKVVAKNLRISPGGVTANNLTQASKLGLKCAWTGALGDDAHAEYLLAEFRKDGVHVPISPTLAPAPTQQFWSWRDAGGAVGMIGIAGASRALTPTIVRRRFSDAISKARHFHTEIAIIPLSAALEGMRIAKKAGARVFLDIDSDPFYLIDREHIGTRAELTKMLALTDVAKMTESAALALAKASALDRASLSKILRMGPSIVAVTRADKGCIVADKKNLKKIPPTKVHIIDSVGAGDAFMGGLSYALLRGFSLGDAGKFANACGAFKCTRVGTRSSGSLREIKRFI